MMACAAPQGIGLRPHKSSAAGAKVHLAAQGSSRSRGGGTDKHYDWRHLPRWWQLSMHLCIAAYVACLAWDLATLAPQDPTYAVLQAFAAAFTGGVSLLLHHLEGRWFAQWHAARTARSTASGWLDASPTSSRKPRVGSTANQVSLGSWLGRQPIWFVTVAVAMIAGAIAGILLAEAMVFGSPAAMEGATTSGPFGFYPNVVAFNWSTISGLASSISPLAFTYRFYHGVLPFCLLPTSDLPVWLLPLLVWDMFLGWACLMLRFMPYPGHRCMTGFGVGFLFPIHDCYRLSIRGVRLWGLPTIKGRSDFSGKLIKLATFPYLYYVFFHGLAMVTLKAAAGSYEFPEDVHNFPPNPNVAVLRWLDPSPFPNTTRAELTGIELFEVLDFPIAPLTCCWTLWLLTPLPMAFMALHAVGAKTAWPSQRRVWPVVTILTSLSCWVAPLGLCLDSLLPGTLESAGVAPVLITWIVFCLSTEVNGFMAGLVSALTEIATDPSTFEPELSQVRHPGSLSEDS